MKVYTQLNFGGNCEEAFRFYEKNLGGKVLMMMSQDQSPGSNAKELAGRGDYPCTAEHRRYCVDRKRCSRSSV